MESNLLIQVYILSVTLVDLIFLLLFLGRGTAAGAQGLWHAR